MRWGIGVREDYKTENINDDITHWCQEIIEVYQERENNHYTPLFDDHFSSQLAILSNQLSNKEDDLKETFLHFLNELNKSILLVGWSTVEDMVDCPANLSRLSGYLYMKAIEILAVFAYRAKQENDTEELRRLTTIYLNVQKAVMVIVQKLTPLYKYFDPFPEIIENTSTVTSPDKQEIVSQ